MFKRIEAKKRESAEKLAAEQEDLQERPEVVAVELTQAELDELQESASAAVSSGTQRAQRKKRGNEVTS